MQTARCVLCCAAVVACAVAAQAENLGSSAAPTHQPIVGNATHKVHPRTGRDPDVRSGTHGTFSFPPFWFSAISEDLEPWQTSGISQGQVRRRQHGSPALHSLVWAICMKRPVTTHALQVEAVYCKSQGGGFRLQIKDGQIYIVGETPSIEDRHRNLEMLLLHAQAMHTLPDVDIGHLGSGESHRQLQLGQVHAQNELQLFLTLKIICMVWS